VAITTGSREHVVTRLRRELIADGAVTCLRHDLGGMNWRDRITIEAGKRGGKPCIRGLRITVSDILEYLASGMSANQILADFPDLEADDIRAALAFAAERERRLIELPPA